MRFRTKKEEEKYRKYLKENVPRDKVSALYSHIVYRCNTKRREHATYYGLPVFWQSGKEFAKWFYEVQDSYMVTKEYIKGYEYQIDKNIFGGSQKRLWGYHPSVCVFIPKYLNTMIETTAASRGSLPLGVVKGRSTQDGKPTYSVYLSILGRRSDLGNNSHFALWRTVRDINTAHLVYKKCKEHYIKNVTKTFYNLNLITKRVYDALMNYEVIDDSGLLKLEDYHYEMADLHISNKELISQIDEMFDKFTIPEILKMNDNILKW